MTKKEACALLCISPTTLQRRISKGQYKFTRTGEGQFAELSFTFADLGLPEPVGVFPLMVGRSSSGTESVPQPEPVLPSSARPESVAKFATHHEPTFAPSPLSPIELKEQADLRFAQDFRLGLVGDSAGNKIDGTNEKWPTRGAQSLVGTADMYDNDGTPTETQPHMNPALIGAPDAIHAQRHSFDAGLSDEHHAQMMRDWRKRNGNALSMSQQREAIERSKANINAAFDYARRG